MATAAAAAKHIFISTSRFRDLVASGVIKHRPPGKYVLDEIREQYISNAQKIMAGRSADGGKALSEQRARLADAQANAAEFKNAQAMGQFVELSLMGRMLKELFLGMRETVLGTSGKIADSLTPHTPLDRAEIYNVIHAELCEMLEALSDPDGLAEAAAGQSKKASR